jgi:hypothetical protein
VITERVKHRTKPSEPFGQPGQHGVINRTKTDGPLRIAPAGPGIPAQAHVTWGEGADAFTTWERLTDLVPLGKSKKS